MMRVGIDLGTTNTVVSYIDENGMWKLLEFKRCGSIENKFFLPSCVAVENGRIIVGQKALDFGIKNPENLLKNTKCFMGSGKTKSYVIGALTLTPMEVAEYILTEVRTELAKQFPDEQTFNAFVTVPACFTEPARFETQNAMRNAGFEVGERSLTDEPISASVAYSSNLDKARVIFVVDIGGGTFDLSLIKAEIVGTATNTDNIETLGWGGEMKLGGNDVDEIIVKDIARQIKEETGKSLYCASGSILGTNEETQAAAIIRTLPFSIKKQLYSKNPEATVTVPELLKGYDLNYTLTADTYKSLMSEISARLSENIDNIFVASPSAMSDVDHVLVVGGMAHEICLQEILYARFGADKVLIPDDAMYLVSKGAAICNSNMSVHIENKAYSSIGLLKENGKDVVPIITEGETIKYGKVFDRTVEASDEKATSIIIKLVEYRGKFNPKRYNVIFHDEIALTGNDNKNIAEKARGFFNKIIKKETFPRINVEIRFSEDKILVISATQNDGTVTKLNHRIGG